MSDSSNVKISRKQWIASFAILGAIVIVLSVGLYFMIHSLTGREQATQGSIDVIEQYDYNQVTVDGISLHQIVTTPSNISFEVIRSNVTTSGRAGINGGFFEKDHLLSIAMLNGTPLLGKIDDYGSGGENVSTSRGTLVWDGQANSLSVQLVQSAKDIKVKDYSRFWAQGGISMSLQDDTNWLGQAEQEAATLIDSDHLRSAIVYDQEGRIYLIVSETETTLAKFRHAIQQMASKSPLVDGIFLDHDGSSQMNIKEKQLNGDAGHIMQMIRLLR